MFLKQPSFSQTRELNSGDMNHWMHSQVIPVFCQQAGTQTKKKTSQQQGRTNSVQHKLDLMLHFIDSVQRRVKAKCIS